MKKIKKLIPIIAICIMAIILTVVVKKSGQPLSVSMILKYTPQNLVLAALVLLLFFALKSLTFVLPISVLYLTSGVLFPSPLAVLVSTCGLAITITVPYWIGRYSGNEAVQEICRKYPKAGQVAKYQEKNIFFACFITRIVGFLPADVVSLYFGACGITYPLYLIAGVTGSFLSVVTTTLLGEKISNPFSIEFVVVLVCRIIVSVDAIVINYGLNHWKKQ